jgi:DNA adenine methylase
MRAPFPWFGGKSRVAEMIWDYLGPVPNYVEPFAGSLAVLLLRPHPPGVETVNDKDCYLANFWRAVQADPEAVAYHADWPVNEADLHARHLWLVCQEGFRDRMMTDPLYYDAQIAGWWVWGISQWIGSGWCSRPEWRGRGSASVSPRGVHGIAQKRPALGRGGRGVVRQLPDLSGCGNAAGRSIHGSGLSENKSDAIIMWMLALSERLRNVRVACGDWSRVTGRSPTECIGLTGILLDPPYGERAGRRKDLYSQDCLRIAEEVREWAIAHGDNPRLRIVLCGYEGEHKMPDTWRCRAWKANGGYGNTGNAAGRDNAERERIWFSPHCLDPEGQPELFESKPVMPAPHEPATAESVATVSA